MDCQNPGGVLSLPPLDLMAYGAPKRDALSYNPHFFTDFFYLDAPPFPYDVGSFRACYWRSAASPLNSAVLATPGSYAVTIPSHQVEDGVDYEEAICVFRVPGLSRRGLGQGR